MKKIKPAVLTILAIVLFSNFQCENEIRKETGQLEYLTYGTSFGECGGYCIREIIVSGDITFTKRAWISEEEYPDSSCNIVFIMDPLPGYMNKIDLEEFFALQDTLGCPDCDDGGAEWLELGFKNEVKRVTFEFMKEPNELKDIIPSLREAMESFNDCRSAR